jgi:nucleoside-diphosphate-sugar epimerase
MRILITGKNSFIGSSVKSWLNDKQPSFIVDEMSLRNIDLNTVSFKDYDVIVHVAGIAHISSKKKLIPEYFKINRDLAIEVAKKSIREGVKQFIFTSSMAIYGDDKAIGNFTPIDINKPKPTNSYGQSKLEADLAIQNLQTNNFSVSILRIPMVYGKTAKGNFLKLVNISQKLSIFPKIKNIRSVLHINNLTELIRLIIVNKLHGVFYPQDHKYFNTTDFLFRIRTSHGKKTLLILFFSLPLLLLSLLIKSINKIYGNKFYESSSSTIKKINYQIYSIENVIEELKNI